MFNSSSKTNNNQAIARTKGRFNEHFSNHINFRKSKKNLYVVAKDSSSNFHEAPIQEFEAPNSVKNRKTDKAESMYNSKLLCISFPESLLNFRKGFQVANDLGSGRAIAHWKAN